MGKWRKILAYALAFGALSSFLIMAMIFLRLTYLPSHPIQRRAAMVDIVVSAISTALLGGLSLVVGIFYEPFMAFVEGGILFTNNWDVIFRILMFEYRTFIAGFLGLATLTMLIMFIRNFLQLATSVNNPGKRSEALKSLFLTGIGTAGLGWTFWAAFALNVLTNKSERSFIYEKFVLKI